MNQQELLELSKAAAFNRGFDTVAEQTLKSADFQARQPGTPGAAPNFGNLLNQGAGVVGDLLNRGGGQAPRTLPGHPGGTPPYVPPRQPGQPGQPGGNLLNQGIDAAGRAAQGVLGNKQVQQVGQQVLNNPNVQGAIGEGMKIVGPQIQKQLPNIIGGLFGGGR